MDYKAYLTDEDYEKAARNGITARALYQRFYQYFWDIERAVTQPMRAKEGKSKAKELQLEAKKNGIYIAQSNIYRRMKSGMSDEDIVTTPKQMKHKASDKYYKYREMAKQNGISSGTFSARINTYHWTYERAATEPVHVMKRKRSS